MIGNVAAVICTRNGHSRGFLAEALTSVFEQTVTPAEIILVDDGSTDGTAEEVRRAYPAVTVLSSDGTGLAAARNTGIRAAHSKWIAFLDDDDVWLPAKLAQQLAQAEASPQPESTIWASRVAIIGKSRKKDAPVLERTLKQFAGWPACLLGSPVTPSGVLLARSLLLRMGLFKENISAGSAYECWIRCLAAGANLCFSKDILVCHRRHQAQMTDSSHELAFQVDIDTLLLPYLEQLQPALARRIGLARVLIFLRMCAWQRGLASARDYWALTPLRPKRLNLRSCVYFVLDSAASKAPNAVRQRLRSQAVRLLIGDS
jgi:hypothetical protein